jgi:acyl-CoA reductase-like NAD-dependent aldehyde dehydrogenase
MQRIMGLIRSGKQQGTSIHFSGHRHGAVGYWIHLTIFTNTRRNTDIVKEISGPVVINFEDVNS